MAGRHEGLVRRYYQKAAVGDGAAIDELLDAEFVLHTPASGQDVRGPKAYKDMIAAYKQATPGLRIEVKDIQEDGDDVTVRWTAHFKHTGRFKDKGPTGKEGTLDGVDRIRIRDGKIVEITNEMDLGTVERQVGFKPTID
jgi:steroid delta-isomerase-like uncharacterized protein